MSQSGEVVRTFKFNVDVSDAKSKINEIEEIVNKVGQLKKVSEEGITVAFKSSDTSAIKEVLELLKPVVDVDVNFHPNTSELDTALEITKDFVESVRDATSVVDENVGRVKDGFKTLTDEAQKLAQTLGESQGDVVQNQVKNLREILENVGQSLNLNVNESNLISKVESAVKKAISAVNKKGEEIGSVKIAVKAGDLSQTSVRDAIKNVKEALADGKISSLKIPIVADDSSISSGIKKAISEVNKKAEDIKAVRFPAEIKPMTVSAVNKARKDIQQQIDALRNSQLQFTAKITVSAKASENTDKIEASANRATDAFYQLWDVISVSSEDNIKNLTEIKKLIDDIAKSARSIRDTRITVKDETGVVGKTTKYSASELDTIAKRSLSQTSGINTTNDSGLIKYYKILEAERQVVDALAQGYKEAGDQREKAIKYEDEIRKKLQANTQEIQNQVNAYREQANRLANENLSDAGRAQVEQLRQLAEQTANILSNAMSKAMSAEGNGIVNQSALDHANESLVRMSGLVENIQADAAQIVEVERQAQQEAERLARDSVKEAEQRLSSLLKTVTSYTTSSNMRKAGEENLSKLFFGSDDQIRDIENARDAIRSLQEELKNLSGGLSQDEYDNKLKKFNDEVVNLENAIARIGKKPLFGEQFLEPGTVKNLEDAKEAILEINGVSSDQSGLKWAQKAKGDIVTLTASFTDQEGHLRSLSGQWDQAGEHLKDLGNSEKETASFMERFTKILQQRGEALGAYLATFASFYKVIAEVKKGFDIVKQMDTNMTELRRVSGATEQQLQSFKNTVFDMGREIGSSSDTLVKLAADYSRLGYSLKEAQNLASSTAMYMNVGFISDADSAMESLTSTMKGFGLAASDVSRIVDEFNEVGKRLPLNGYIGQRAGTLKTEQRLNILPQCA